MANGMKRLAVCSLGVLTAAMLAGGLKITSAAAPPMNGWYEENGGKYWYENGVRQGTTGRGKEIYDPVSDAWYWLDADQNGRMAANKDVYLENGDKWVRYDGDGHMVKGDQFYNGNWYRFNVETGAMVKGEQYYDGGWYRFDVNSGVMIKGWYRETENDGTVKNYYYDPVSGKMVKGEVTIGNDRCYFDTNTGVGLDMQWLQIGSGKYWYEGGIRQGTTGRGKEIYDPASNAWYWLDAVDQGKMAVSKDVYQESNGGKWVRYDQNGHMIKGHNKYQDSWYHFDDTTGAMTKGWYSETLQNGTVNTYYFDPDNGKRTHGLRVIDKVECAFDDTTGIALDKKWRTIDGANYWYEGGKRQGTTGRGVEIYDPASKAWYWLDASEQGRMAVNKDVYLESNGGKWVRYDQYGHMVKGWSLKDGKRYYFDPATGAMVKGKVTIDGVEYYFNKDTGVLESSDGNSPVNYVWDEVKCTYKKADGTVDYYVEKYYDSQDRMVREVTSSANGNLRGVIEYGYDNSGNLLRHYIYNEKSMIVKSYEYEYDSSGNEKSMEYIDKEDSSKSYIKEYIYNTEGKLGTIKTYSITNRGNVLKTEEVCYWEGDKLLQKSIFNINGTARVYVNYYAYRYDAKGNLVEETYGRNVAAENKDYQVWRKTYGYDGYGNCVYCEECDENDNKVRETIYEYYTDRWGNSSEKSVIIKNGDGSVVSGYEYTRSGVTPIQYTKFGENKNVEYYTKYDQTAFPSDKTTHTTTDYSYNANGMLRQIIVTEYRMNQYGG